MSEKGRPLGFDLSHMSITTTSLAFPRGAPHVLRVPSQPVDVSDPEALAQCEELAREMCYVMWKEDGVAIAAPQVGCLASLVVINEAARLPFSPAVLINPAVVEASEETEIDDEGCLSLPGYRGRVPRSCRVRVTYHDLTGAPRDIAAEGYAARVLQHEIDHLHGTLYVDRIKDWSADLRPTEPGRFIRAGDLIAKAKRT
jgi:peptide deformylase